MKQHDLLFILISSTLVIVLWIIFGVVHNSITSTITQSTASDIKPINNSFDTKTIQALKTRSNINPQSAVALSPTPLPTPTLAPISPIPPLQSLSIPVSSQGGQKQ